MGANTFSQHMTDSNNPLIVGRFFTSTLSVAYFWFPDKKYRVKKARYGWTVKSSASETIDVRVLRSGDTTLAAAGVGDRLLAAAIDTTQDANTALETAAVESSDRIVGPGDKVFFVPSGTPTGLAGGYLELHVDPIE